MLNPEQVRYIHEKADELTRWMILESAKRFQKVPPCKEGCSSCCYEPVIAEQGEIEVALEYAREHFTPEEREGLLSRIREAALRLGTWGKVDEYERKVGEEKEDVSHLLRSYRALRLPCPFLDFDSGACRVYPVRPYSCRVHLALGPKRFCDEDALRPRQTYLLVPEEMAGHILEEALAQFSNGSAQVGFGLLPELLARVVPQGAKEAVRTP